MWQERGEMKTRENDRRTKKDKREGWENETGETDRQTGMWAGGQAGGRAERERREGRAEGERE